MSVLTAALDICRDEFSRHVDAFGVTATWQRHAASTRTTGSYISTSAASPDHTDDSWVPELNDPTLYPTVGVIRIIKDVPEDISFGAVHHLLSGQSLGYVTYDTGVMAHDVLRIDDEIWSVIGSRLVSPAVYRELTLRRVG